MRRWSKPSIVAMALVLLGCGESAWANCDSPLESSLRDTQRFVASMRADKPGQARVFASDGSEYPAGLVRWMAGELRAAERDCLDANPTGAGRHLAAVQATLSAHSRT